MLGDEIHKGCKRSLRKFGRATERDLLLTEELEREELRRFSRNIGRVNLRRFQQGSRKINRRRLHDSKLREEGGSCK